MKANEIRQSFWDAHPQFKRRGRTKQNDYNGDIRSYWCFWVDHLRRNGWITNKQYNNITL